MGWELVGSNYEKWLHTSHCKPLLYIPLPLSLSAFSFLAVGSRDTSCRVFSAHPLPGFHYVNLAAHRTKLVACFFEKDSLNVSVTIY